MAQVENQSYLQKNSLTFILDDRTSAICTWVLLTVVCQAINIFGIVTNVINVTCFVKQGFKDLVNISFLGLSSSDLASLLMTVGMCVFFTPSLVEADLPFDSIGFMYMVCFLPHLAFTRVSCCITAFITMERCLSIVAPLKVKSIITPKRAEIIVVCIFIIFTFSATPLYTVNWLGMTFSPSRNKTILGIISADNKEQVELYTYFINNFFIPLCSFAIVVVCTVVLTFQLRSNSQRRTTTINEVQAYKLTLRNKKVSKLVVSISCLFISCFVPINIIMCAVGLIPEISITGKYFKASKVLGSVTVIFESINSSVNIFIYHHMSSKYRDTFHALFFNKHKILAKRR